MAGGGSKIIIKRATLCWIYSLLFPQNLPQCHASIKESESCSVVSNSLRPHGLYFSPGQNTGVGSLSLLQAIFPTQGLNPGLLHCRRILSQLNHQGSPRILEWVAYPFSRGSSRPRNWTRVSYIAGEFFTNWAIREVDDKGWNGWMDITDSKDMSLSKLQEMVKNREVWCATVHVVTKSQTWLTKQ